MPRIFIDRTLSLGGSHIGRAVYHGRGGMREQGNPHTNPH